MYPSSFSQYVFDGLVIGDREMNRTDVTLHSIERNVSIPLSYTATPLIADMTDSERPK